MKKIIILLLTIMMCFVGVACGDGNQKADKYCWYCGNGITLDASFCENCGVAVNDNKNEATPTVTIVETQKPVETRVPTVEPTPEPTATPTPKPTATPTPKPTATPTLKPTATPTQKPAHIHSYTTEIIKTTCTEIGYTVYTCSCGEEYTIHETELLEHKWQEATCAMPRHCSVCGTMPDNILAEHESLKLIEQQHATCTEDGFRKSECRLCGEIIETIFPAKGHSYLYVGEVRATCTEGGYAYLSCSCGDSCIGDFTEALGHDYQKTKIVRENCTQGGYTTYACTRCKGSYESDIKDALGHAWVDANCEKPKTCSRCNIYEGFEKHNFNNGKCTKCGDLKPSEGLIFYSISTGYAVDGIDTCTDSEIIIPDSYKGLPVTKVSSNAFLGCKQITSVIIPDSVTKIGSDAFASCENLISITIPDSVTKIESSAFMGCKSLICITIPDSVSSLEQSAFFSCDSLTSVSLGTGITTIAKNTFYGCDSLTSVFINGKITKIDQDAFSSCKILDQITFNGTMDEWHSVVINANWNDRDTFHPEDYTKIKKIACLDGTIYISD